MYQKLKFFYLLENTFDFFCFLPLTEILGLGFFRTGVNELSKEKIIFLGSGNIKAVIRVVDKFFNKPRFSTKSDSLIRNHTLESF